MKRNTVKSSNIKSIGHEGNKLHVEFASGTVYEYEGVSSKQYQDLAGAKSVGAHFAKVMRDDFKGRKLSQEELNNQ